MTVKKIVSLVFAVGLLSTTVVTSAMASSIHHHYKKSYSYSGTLNELGYSATGTTTKAISSSANFTNNSRYIETYVGEYLIGVPTPLNSDEDSTTTSYGGVGASIDRDYDNSNRYYKHNGCLKPYAGIGYTIDSYTYTIYQDYSE